MDLNVIPHEFAFIDEAGFNLTKTRRRGRSIITTMPLWMLLPCMDKTLCHITNNGALHHLANLGPYNTDLILMYLDKLCNTVLQADHMDVEGQNRYVVVWDNVCFIMQPWFKIGLLTDHSLQSFTFPHTLHF